MSPSEPKCPVCSNPTAAAFRPFCSRTCADVDLLRWLRGGYAIPGGMTDEDGETDPLGDGPVFGDDEASPPRPVPRRRDA